MASHIPTCIVCDADATHVCSSCEKFHFCESPICSSSVADLHKAVCFDHRNKETMYVYSHLRDAILDMQTIHADRYSPQEVTDAIDVLVDLPHTKDEAINLIQEHLHDYANESIAADAGLESYTMSHLAHLAYDRVGDKASDDRAAAKRALQAAELERKANLNKQRKEDILAKAKERSEKAKRRGERMRAKQEKRARSRERQAEKLKQRAARAKRRADARGDRVARFGAKRANWQEKAAAKKEARAAKKRGGAKELLSDA